MKRASVFLVAAFVVTLAIEWFAIDAAFAVLEAIVTAVDARNHDVQIHLTLTVDEARELLSAAGTGTPIPDRTAKRVASSVVRALSGVKPVDPPKPRPRPVGWRSLDIGVLKLDRQSEDSLRNWLPPVMTLGDLYEQIELGDDGLLMFDDHRAERVRQAFAAYFFSPAPVE